jgi:chorismate mutase
MMNKMRGIRGAIRAEDNTKESIFAATRTLLEDIVRANDLDTDDIASVFFTATDDLDADYPAYAARDLGWDTVPLLCAREMNVPGGMSRVIRVLLHVNTLKSQTQIKHRYLGETQRLRPDLSGSKQL